MFKLTGIGHLNGRVPLIRQGENLASNLEITLPIDFQGYTYNIITKVNNDPPIYSPPITPVNNILIFPIIIDFTRHDGTITFELLASTAQGIVAKTSKVTYPIVPTLTEQDDEAPDPYSHWLTGFNGAVDEATRQAGLAEKYAITAGTKSLEANGHANTASTHAHDAEQYATTAGEQAGIATTQAGIAEGHATTASQQAGIASGHATTARQQAGIAAGHATTATTKAGEANASAIAAAGSAGTATAKAQIATDKAAETVETLAGTVKKTQKVNGTALSGDITVAASAVPVTPAGSISATNVQGALEDIENEVEEYKADDNYFVTLPDGTKNEFNIDGTYFKKVNTVVLDGSENWEILQKYEHEGQKYSRMRINGWVIDNNSVAFNSTSASAKMNDKNLTIDFRTAATGNYDESIGVYNNILMLMVKQDFTTIKQFKTYLSSNKVILNYKLATPTIEVYDFKNTKSAYISIHEYEYARAYLYSTSKSIAIDYTTKTLKIISGTRILHGGKRYVVNNENQEISFLGFTASFVLQFNSVTSEVSVSQISTEGVELPKLSVVGIFHPTLPIFKMIDSESIEVNGEMYVSQQTIDKINENINSGNKIFFLDSIEGLYTKPDNIESVAEGEPFSLVSSTVNDIYNIYDSLVTNFPEYVSKTLMGNNTGGDPIYSYAFKPVEISDSSIYTKSKLKIIITSAIHGYEQMSAWSTANFFKHLCEHWDTQSPLEFMRWNVEFQVVPVVNPYGYNHNIRENENMIDLNRNFPPAGNASEVETQLLMPFIDSHSDAQFHIDHHNISSGYPMTYSACVESTNIMTNLWRTMTRKWRKDYPAAPQNIPFGRILQSGISGGLNIYSNNTYNIIPITLETPWKMPFATTKYDKITTEVSIDSLGNLLTSICKSYR